MNVPELSLCIINHNGERYLPQTLWAVDVIRDLFREVLLVDNASTDASLEIAQRDFPEVRILPRETNDGPGAARNLGFRSATRDLILFIDNDVILDPDCPARLLEALQTRPDATFAMARVLFDEDRDRIQFDGASAHFLGMMAVDCGPPPGVPGDGIRDIESLISACFLVDRRRWTTDLFDEALFIYQEDHELALRARLSGHRILFVPRARCYHREGTVGLSLRQTGGRYTSVRVINNIRNRWYLILKLYQWRTIFLFSPAFLLFEIFQFLGVVKKGWIGEWVRACFWLGRRLPEIARRRREFARRRRYPDRIVMQAGPIPFHQQMARGNVERAGVAMLNGIARANWKAARIVA